MKRRTTTTLFAAALAMCLSLLSADAFAARFNYKLKNGVTQTDGKTPVLVILSGDSIKSGSVTIRGGGKTLKKKLGRMKAGQTRSIKLPKRNGTTEYRVELKASDGKQTSSIGFAFKTVRVAPIKLRINRDDVDVNQGRLNLRTNRPLKKVDVELFDAKNRSLGKHSQEIGGKAGALKIKWAPVKDVSALRVIAHDVDGFWAGVVLEPWWIEIKHEEINFASGKHEIVAAEEHKLEASLKEIRAQMKRFAKHRKDMRLYIAGYTDSVGKAADNQQLSEQRARSIASWFRKKGLKVQLYYQGFGEDGQAVKTGDNVDNEKNRRALYVLGNTAPPRSHSIPRGNWKRLR